MPRNVLVAAVFVLLGRAQGIGAPGDPFALDDTGCFPQDAATTKCEDAVAKALAKASACVSKCHRDRTDGKLPDASAEDGCEAQCQTAYDKAVGATSRVGPLCPADYGPSYRASLFSALQLGANAGNGANYPASLASALGRNECG